jgi:hypothetical protein
MYAPIEHEEEDQAAFSMRSGSGGSMHGLDGQKKRRREASDMAYLSSLEKEDDHMSKKSTHVKEEEEVFIVGIPQACLQGLLLLIMTILVTVLHERGRPGDSALISLQTWSVTTVNPCRHEEVEVDCFITSASSSTTTTTMHAAGAVNASAVKETHTNDTAHTDGTAAAAWELLLTGTYERPQGELNQRLFNVVGVPFLILCSHVISTPFFIGYIRESSHDDTHSSTSIFQKNLKRVGMLLLLVFACSFLFLQSAWSLPGNNLLLCELWLMCALFYISFHPASHYSEYARQQYTPTRYLEFAFTLPLLAVAAACAAGMTDVDDVNWIFFSSLFMCLFLLCAEYHHHKILVLKAEADDDHVYATRILILNALFCLVALAVPASRCVEQAMRISEVTEWHLEWGPVSLQLLLLLHVVYFLAVAVHRLLPKSAMCGIEPPSHALIVLLLDGISLIGRALVSLLIISGALDMQSA